MDAQRAIRNNSGRIIGNEPVDTADLKQGDTFFCTKEEHDEKAYEIEFPNGDKKKFTFDELNAYLATKELQIADPWILLDNGNYRSYVVGPRDNREGMAIPAVQQA